MPPSKVHLYLVSFVRENVAFQDRATGLYGLGSFAIQLGLAAIRQLDVIDLAADTLIDLRDRTDCAVYLSLWGDRGPCIVAKADGSLQGVFSVRLGYMLPLTATATGLVFLTHLPETETERALDAQAAFEGRGTGRRASRAALSTAISQVRHDGYASTLGRLHRNFAGIAAPIFDYSGQIAAAITLLGPAEYMRDGKQDELAQLLLEAAAGISLRLGAPGSEDGTG